MKRNVIIIGVVAGVLLWCWPATYKYGDGTTWHVTRVALGPKLARFVGRHQAYGRLAREITAGIEADEAQVRAIFAWTVEHVDRHIPLGTVVPDDHIWSIIQRGYGSDDQLADVCTTLCTYAGVRGAAHRIKTLDGHSRYVALVQLREVWVLLDPFEQVLIENAQGQLASIEELIEHPEWVDAAARRAGIDPAAYARVLAGLRPVTATQFLRTELQAPWPRVRHEFFRWRGNRRQPGFYTIGEPHI